ncbi:LytR/AlgR family response regulator transcription factor [Zunongwangia sp. HRR-M8]|uniref:LytR/AlgR family response regulator transcription factor n=1 Tax=Zunongwangia sp. HRR-M8 TaxID=3015170 RepID=UPI0022DE873D|nr:LytTR family DNA-binding domain-containing protein [Zunongwangia sp. HRR-M8]WBL21017.1 LytTR family DNA-binding domain-containing protein [Zunongwangia sp. HRR-M8]
MKIVIVEDEKPAARGLNRLLNKKGLEVEVMLHSVAEGISWFSENEHPDLIFLDIQLSDGLSFEIFEAVKVKSAIIFTTAYDEYALKAFKLNSVDYLLKPIDDEELDEAIDKFENTFQSKSVKLNVDDFRNLLSLSSSDNYKSRFTIQIGQHLKIIDIEEVVCFYSENKATYIHNKEGRSYLMDFSLEQLEKELNPKLFFRINRKCIVQLKAIKDIISYTNSRLELKLTNFNEFQMIVSRERVKDFKNWIS